MAKSKKNTNKTIDLRQCKQLKIRSCFLDKNHQNAPIL